MKRILLPLFSLAVFSLALISQTPTPDRYPVLTEGEAETVGLSPERLARIDRMCEEAVETDQVPGMVALVARNGKIAYWKAYGTADVETGKKFRKDDIFRIASQSKAITATAVMMLWEEGRFQLDDPVSRFIPAFAHPQVLETFHFSDTTWTGRPAASEITIRELLNHTSGLGYGLIDGDERFRMIYQKAGVTDLFTTEPVTIRESVEKLATLPLHHDPGTDWVYSEGLDVLGYLIEVVSGMPFDQFLQTRLFDPLGMDDTGFYLPDRKADRLVPVQRPANGSWERYPVTFYDPQYPVKGAKSFFSGGAGLSSTARDYAVFLQMYLNGGAYGGVRILSRTTVDFILANQIGDIWGKDADSYFGLAFSVVTPAGQDKGGQGSAGTFSWGGYFNTQYFADPAEQVIGIIMKQTQGTNKDQTEWRFRQLVFQCVDD